ncbi:hydroxymethylpyrimidine/phosphomethylpyrimidine kinase [Thiofaba sp. EF100]|jgi:hydroxymethylpyrimidine/phosphomethylpyrimidine kinase|uniref:bifunctional hydroxymethylpyrimidine kinase/phosphomethylpyrimidine kinase n=1 Tax=Thiofaba sp. EF100 TaxID=3121274 RepID=UPI003221BDD5
MQDIKPPPVVLVFAGLDPTGGAGLSADIEAIISQGCHAAPIATALTVQDTRDVIRVGQVDALLVVEQARALLEDMPVAAIKLGMLGSAAMVEAIHTILRDYPQIPVVLDPVLRAGGGTELADEELIDAMRELLIPQATILTPNSEEARRLAPDADNLHACALSLLEQGSEYVLITGTHEPTPEVENLLFGGHRLLETFSWPRLAESFHGSGCTLASAIAGLLAQGHEPMTAIHQAQDYTWQALEQAYRLGRGQMIPNRLFWTGGEDDVLDEEGSGRAMLH